MTECGGGRRPLEPGLVTNGVEPVGRRSDSPRRPSSSGCRLVPLNGVRTRATDSVRTERRPASVNPTRAASEISRPPRCDYSPTAGPAERAGAPRPAVAAAAPIALPVAAAAPIALPVDTEARLPHPHSTPRLHRTPRQRQQRRRRRRGPVPDRRPLQNRILRTPARSVTASGHRRSPARAPQPTKEGQSRTASRGVDGLQKRRFRRPSPLGDGVLAPRLTGTRTAADGSKQSRIASKGCCVSRTSRNGGSSDQARSMKGGRAAWALRALCVFDREGPDPEPARTH